MSCAVAGIYVLNRDLVYDRGVSPVGVIAGIARRGFDDRSPREDAMLMQGKGIIGQVTLTGSSLVVPDVSLNPHYVIGRERTRSEIAVAIVSNKQSIGALNLESDQLAAYDESDLEVLQFFADAASIAIEKAMLHRELVEKRLLEKQLELARDLQFRLFPDKSPQLTGYDIAGICIPTEEIGGDYYDFIPLPRSRIGVAVADVAGHGIASALVMTAFRGLLRTYTLGSLEMAKIADTINHQLPEFTGGSNFVTTVYAMLSSRSEELTFINCGHPPPLLIHPDGSSSRFNEHGPALGIIERTSFPTQKIYLSQGDILSLYTDGVVELTDQADQQFGVERLASIIHQNRELPAAGLIERVIQATHEFSGSCRYPDDFTLVIIKREGQVSRKRKRGATFKSDADKARSTDTA